MVALDLLTSGSMLPSPVIFFKLEGTSLTLVGSTLEPARVMEAMNTLTEILDPAVNRSIPARTSHPNAKRVVVRHIDEAVYQPYVTDGGRNGQHGKVLISGHVFESATEAGRHIGCLNNEVVLALSNARRNGQIEAKARGVTFSYAADMGGGD